jgi:outer membrane protein OmpA-like peptidoglycan-associated protein
MKKQIVFMTIVALLCAAMYGCSSMSKSQKGAVIGGTAGAVAGAAIGKAAGNTAVGAILGAAIGGAAGAYIGHQMDEQAAEIERDIEGAQVERVGEGIKITFDSGILFDIDSSSLKPVAQENLEKLAVILNKYEDTDILIEGHTDSTGSEDHNLELSRRRSQSVANHLAGAQVNAARFTIMGYGEMQPVASNDTADGRAMNRRVDIAIMANEEMKKAAQDKTTG